MAPPSDSGGVSTGSFTACAALVRGADYDRFLSALFAREAARPHLLALYAFNHEVAKTAESVRQPIAGQIRLQWWRDAIAELYGAKTRRHDVVEALAQTVRRYQLPRGLFDGIIDARENDLIETPFENFAALEAYADATSGNLMRLAVCVLNPGATGSIPSLDEVARDAGVAYALSGLLRALPFHAARRRLMLPQDALKHSGLSPEDVFAGKASSGLSLLIAEVAGQAQQRLDAARKSKVRRALLPAFLPASVVSLYLKRVTRAGFDPFRDATDVPLYQRQFAMLRALLRARV